MLANRAAECRVNAKPGSQSDRSTGPGIWIMQEDSTGRRGGKGSASHCPFPTPPTPPSFPRSKLKCLHGSKTAGREGGEVARGFKISATTQSCNKKKKSPARGEELHMHTCNYYKSVLKTCHFLTIIGNYLTLFWLFVSFVWNWHLSQKKALLPLRPPAPLSLETAHEREREKKRKRERESVRKRGWGRKPKRGRGLEMERVKKVEGKGDKRTQEIHEKSSVSIKIDVQVTWNQAIAQTTYWKTSCCLHPPLQAGVTAKRKHGEQSRNVFKKPLHHGRARAKQKKIQILPSSD